MGRLTLEAWAIGLYDKEGEFKGIFYGPALDVMGPQLVIRNTEEEAMAFIEFTQALKKYKKRPIKIRIDEVKDALD